MARDKYLTLEERLFAGSEGQFEWTKRGKIKKGSIPDLWANSSPPFYPRMRQSTFREFGRILDEAMNESIEGAKRNPSDSIGQELGPIQPGEPGYISPGLLDRLIEEERQYYKLTRRFMRLVGIETPTRHIPV